MATNTGFVSNLLGKLSNAKSGLADALLGSAQVTPLTNNKYPAHIQDYLDNLETQPYMQDLLSKPKEEALTLDQYKEGVTQGLNFGVPEIANWQKENGINVPKTDEEISLAHTGDFNSYPLQAGLEGSERQGGILRDFFGGYRDNYLNGFKPDNWAPEKKSFSTHAGELLGSVGRFIDSPLGRGLIAGGLTAALGYKNPLKEGLAAVAGRQGAVTKDKLYRKQLQDMGIDTSDISGNITSDIYKDLANNTYRQNSLELRQQTAESQNRLRELQIEKQQILNSTLPEEQKAKLMKLNAEAAHAEEMQLARINYYNNAVANPLGWANYGLKADANERQNKEFEAKQKEMQAKLKALEELTGGNKPTAAAKQGGTTSSGTKYKVVK